MEKAEEWLRGYATWIARLRAEVGLPPQCEHRETDRERK